MLGRSPSSIVTFPQTAIMVCKLSTLLRAYIHAHVSFIFRLLLDDGSHLACIGGLELRKRRCAK